MNFKYLYTINYPDYQKGLCRLEVKALFNQEMNKKYVLSDEKVNPSRSPYIKERVDVHFIEKDINVLINKIKQQEYKYNDYKVEFLKIDQYDVSYKDRMNYVKEIGLSILGKVELHHPKKLLVLIRLNNQWIYGECVRNDFKWHIHDSKPCTYSNSLGIRVARALINIAVKNDFSRNVIDPCCGVGTVVIEGLSMNVNIVGSDINKSIVSNARRNLEFFGYNKNTVENKDIHTIEDQYDVAIVDIPYGLFSPTTLEIQKGIISRTRIIAKKAIIVTFEEMDNLIEDANFEIEDKCIITKGNFHRHIYCCK